MPFVRIVLASLAIVWASAATVAAAGQARPYVGRPVAEVLKELQDGGLRLVFSSDLVTPAMRVRAEPTAREPRRIAVEILGPHGLTLRDGPRGTLLVVAKPKAPRPTAAPQRTGPADDGKAAPPPDTPDPMRVEEFVDVSDRLVNQETGSTAYVVRPTEIRETPGGFDNPFHVFQVLPGVAAIDDESGKLAVRGAGPEHNIVVLDGVQIHNPYRFSELTSSFLNTDTAATVSLDASGLDARYGGRLSSVTAIETRDGTRERRLAASGAIGLANGHVLLEGRLPNTETGSWWLTTRGTYYRPVVGLFRSGVMPSFGDVQFKMTVRPTPRTSVSVFALAGRESMDNRDRIADTTSWFNGSNALGLATLKWTPNRRLATTTTVSAYTHGTLDHDESFPLTDAFERRADVQDFAVRQHVVFAIAPKHVLDAGVDVHRIRSVWHMQGVKPPIFERGVGPSTWGEGVVYPPGGAVDSRLARTQFGAWLQDRLPIGSRLTIEPGVRLDWNSYTEEAVWQPRVRVAARLAGAAVWAGYAEQSQTPGHERLQGFDYFQLPESDAPTLRNERSRQVVVGFERAFAAGFDLRVEGYRRRFDRLLVQRLETDAERATRLLDHVLPSDLPPDTVLLERRPTVFPESTGRGTAHGVELLLRRTGDRVSGWVGYTYSRTTREAHGYTFPFDFDRPHTVTAAGTLRLASRLRFSLTALHASGFAITPLHQEVFFMRAWRLDGTQEPIATAIRNPDGSLHLAPNPGMRRLSLRNQERLAGYARADVRVTYASGGRWEFYGEVINVFDHRNYLQTMPVPESFGGSQGVTTSNNVYENFERLPSFGVRFRF
jgi:hypothetical protein